MHGRKSKKRPKLPDMSLDPEALDLPEYRKSQFNIKLSQRELDEIKAMAKRFKVGVSDYLIGLHNQAVAAVSRKKPKKGA